MSEYFVTIFPDAWTASTTTVLQIVSTMACRLMRPPNAKSGDSTLILKQSFRAENLSLSALPDKEKRDVSTGIRCTWFDPPDQRCAQEAQHPQIGDGGKMWANLCPEHHAEMERASNEFLDSNGKTDKKRIGWMLRCWVRASGGAKKMVKRRDPA
jgi:hypothetical protein